MSLFPLDIQAEILKKLPTKSLIQFRRVSKQWKSLIDSRCFILSYGFRHTNRFILNYQYKLKKDNDFKVFTLIDNDNENCDTFADQYFAPLDPPGLVKCSTHFNPRVVGSSHGLLCLHGYLQTGDICIRIAVLWNPSIRRSVGIQLPGDQDWIARFGRDFMGFSWFNKIVGFGVCPVTIDPTIINVIYAKSKSDRAWNMLSTNLPLESIKTLNPQVVIDGFIYWVAGERIHHLTYKLLSFDLTAKEFRLINLPDRLTLRCPRISNLRGSLVVLEQTTTSCFLWMMTEGVTPSFTRLYTVNLPVTNLRFRNLLGFRNTGEPIVAMPMDDERRYAFTTLHVYDPHSQQFPCLWIDGDIYSFFMCSYMETLLLFDQSDGYIYHISN